MDCEVLVQFMRKRTAHYFDEARWIASKSLDSDLSRELLRETVQLGSFLYASFLSLEPLIRKGSPHKHLLDFRSVFIHWYRHTEWLLSTIDLRKMPEMDFAIDFTHLKQHLAEAKLKLGPSLEVDGR